MFLCKDLWWKTCSLSWLTNCPDFLRNRSVGRNFQSICQVFVGFFGYKSFIWLILFWDCFQSSCTVPKVNPLSAFLRLNTFESIELSETFWNEEGSLNGIWLHDCQCELHQALCVLDLALGKWFDGSGPIWGGNGRKSWSHSPARFEWTQATGENQPKLPQLWSLGHQILRHIELLSCWSAEVGYLRPYFYEECQFDRNLPATGDHSERLGQHPQYTGLGWHFDEVHHKSLTWVTNMTFLEGFFLSNNGNFVDILATGKSEGTGKGTG